MQHGGQADPETNDWPFVLFHPHFLQSIHDKRQESLDGFGMASSGPDLPGLGMWEHPYTQQRSSQPSAGGTSHNVKGTSDARSGVANGRYSAGMPAAPLI